MSTIMETPKKKLLIIHPIIAPYRIDFFNALNRAFDTNIILFLQNLASQKFDYEKISRLFEFSPKYLCNHYKGLKLPKGLFKEIKNDNPDIILTNECNLISITALLYKFFINRKCKVFSIIDDSYDMAVSGKSFSIKHRIAKKIVIPFFDQIICVEPRVEQYFRKKYNKGTYFPIIADEERIRKKYKDLLPLSTSLVNLHHLEGKKVLLFVGRLVHLKNIQKIIPAFFKLLNKDYYFVIIGDGDMRDELETLAKDCNNILFTGRLEGDKLLAWYNIANVFILPSYKEAFGAVTNEALMAGCYTIVSKLAGSSCLITPRINGDLIDPMSDEEIFNTLEYAMKRTYPISLPLKLRDNNMIAPFNYYISKLIKSF